MQEKKIMSLLSILLFMIVLGGCNSAQGQVQSESREVAVGACRIAVNVSETILSNEVFIHGTGDIGGARTDPIGLGNEIPDAETGDAEATMLAFVSEAQKLGCTVGNPRQWTSDDGNEISFFVNFICIDERNRLISVIGELMKFPLTLSLHD